jgi:DNA-binding response OmpR family regulator
MNKWPISVDYVMPGSERGGKMDHVRLLIADDEERIRDIIKEYSILEGYLIDEAGDGAEALDLFKKNVYSVIILDVMMPRMDGWNVCREIRKTSHVPVIMLTARGEEYDKLFGFELGVDDYMVKPFSPKELMARVKVFLRRSLQEQSNVNKNAITLDGLVVELDSRNVFVDGSQVSLTPKEFELLKFFILHQNKAFSRDQLLNSVWGYDFIGDDRTVDTHVKMLRESLGQYRKYIITVWGLGYKFEAGHGK